MADKLMKSLKLEGSENVYYPASSMMIPVEATSEDGVTYTATIPGVTELVDGMTIAVKFSRAARETYPGLNINGLGEILIGRKPSSGQISTPLPLKSNAICAGHTYQLTLMQLIPTNVVTRCWILNDCPVLDTPDLSEPVPIEKGGTGATTVEAARANLGVKQIIIKDITIPCVEGTVDNNWDGWYDYYADHDGDGNPDYDFNSGRDGVAYAVYDTDITAADVVTINLDYNSLLVAEECSLKSMVKSWDPGDYDYDGDGINDVHYDGCAEIVADSIPSAEMTGTMVILKGGN